MAVSITAGKGKELFQQVFPPEQWKVHAKFKARSGKLRMLFIRKDQRALNPDAAIVDLDVNDIAYPWAVAKEGGAWQLSEEIADEHITRTYALPLQLDYDRRLARSPLPIEPPPPPPSPNAGLPNFGRF